MSRILVCGDRNWTDVETIENLIMSLPPDTIIIHGNCRGADKIAERKAKEHGLTVRGYSADWDQYGKAAGPIRNKQMLLDGKPDKVVAFHNDISKSRGTADMLRQAEKRGVTFEIRSTPKSFDGVD